MYQVIGLRRLLSVYGSIAAAIALCAFLLDVLHAGDLPAGARALLAELRDMVGWGLTGATFLFGLGETRLFAWACRFPPLGLWFPPIEGDWEGELTSNWPQIAARAGLAPGDAQPVAITAYIRARLLTTGMATKSATGYSSSETVVVGLEKRGQKDVLRLAYVYEGRTPVPLATDSSQHYGAALLDLCDNGGRLTLEGSYWTNRNWTRGLNTAGSIVLRRKPT